MEVIQMFKCALIVAMIATPEILCVQGRQFRQTNDQDFTKLTSTPATTTADKKQHFQLTPQDHNIPSITAAHHHSAPGLGHEDAFRPAPKTPGKGPGIGYSYTFRPVPTTPNPGNDHTYAFRLAPSTPGKGHGHAYAFRPAPTTPGKGPGNGYSYANENEGVEATGANYNGRYSTTEAKDDFSPTSPGHSPDVGHAIGSNAQPNAETKYTGNRTTNNCTQVAC